jgi:CheY-like chemotaxis protein
VGLRSRPGRDSVFFVTAPLGLAALKLRAEPGAPEPVAAGEPLNGLKVLAIDNDPRVLEGMRVLLRRRGCRVATADGLEEAEAALDAFGAPDVVIADYHLDSGDGIAAIQAVRERFGRSIAAILVTADRSPEARDEAARADVVVMNKPLKPAPLRAQLTRYSAMRARQRNRAPPIREPETQSRTRSAGASRSSSRANGNNNPRNARRWGARRLTPAR